MTREEHWLLQEKYQGAKNDAFLADCARLNRGEPLAYLIGSIPFLDTTIQLDSRPLIPRAETEFWCQQAIADITKSMESRHRTSHLHILDLCAGSGCIGVAVLSELPLTDVDFVEIDVRHHKTIQNNIQTNGLDESRIRILGGDLFDGLPQIPEKYDVILTNPPYIDRTLNRVDAHVVAHEPHHALYGGYKGMEIIKRIIVGLPKHLKKTGVCYLEHEPEQVHAIDQSARRAGLTTTHHLDQYGVLRYTTLRHTPTT